MLVFISALLAAVSVFFRDRGDVALEVLSLRQQVAVLKRGRPRPPLNAFEWLLWTTLRHFWMIAAFDSFAAPTVTFKLLYCFFIIEHGRRKILHFNITRCPSAEWVVQQLREAFPEAGPYRYAIFDRDSKFDTNVIDSLKATGLKPKQTSVQSLWQNGVPERWVGSCRREILDHVIPLNEDLRRLLRDFANYYHDDRIHDSLEKDTPNRRPMENKRYEWRQAA